MRLPKPTGDPEANRLHEEALLIEEELEAMEHTQVIDDSPVPAAGSDDTIDLFSSDSEMNALDVPVRPPTRAPTRAPAPAAATTLAAPAFTAASGKRKAEPSPAFRAVARKVGASTRPAQSQVSLDAATTQIASVFSPANEDRLADRQRDDITILTLNDSLRDLRAELSQERERRFALERQLRDEEMRRLVEQQVQRQLQHQLLAHQATPTAQPPAENRPHQIHSYAPNPHPATGEAHSSWMTGPPPERSDASGSKGM